ncbi:MAG: hypothetical protein JST61_10365, partial [Acidobacteria bacterium]|nr:hypothetical protein [Acidobacteriota bacterium]
MPGTLPRLALLTLAVSVTGCGSGLIPGAAGLGLGTLSPVSSPTTTPTSTSAPGSSSTTTTATSTSTTAASDPVHTPVSAPAPTPAPPVTAPAPAPTPAPAPPVVTPAPAPAPTPMPPVTTPAPTPTPTPTPTPAPVPAPQQLACSVMSLGQGANLNGFLPFAANDAWRQDISAAPLDGNSAGYIGFIGNSHLYANFGAGQYNGSTIGIPYTVVSGTQFTTVNYTAYGDESDPGPMPFASSTPIEGDPNPGDGDRHSLVLDRDNCWLYELGGAYPQGDGTWQAAAGAVWDLLNVNARPFRWTSTDAAGLPVFPGLVRYEEVAAGHIDHAIRVTLQRSKAAFV